MFLISIGEIFTHIVNVPDIFLLLIYSTYIDIECRYICNFKTAYFYFKWDLSCITIFLFWSFETSRRLWNLLLVCHLSAEMLHLLVYSSFWKMPYKCWNSFTEYFCVCVCVHKITLLTKLQIIVMNKTLVYFT